MKFQFAAVYALAALAAFAMFGRSADCPNGRCPVKVKVNVAAPAVAAPQPMPVGSGGTVIVAPMLHRQPVRTVLHRVRHAHPLHTLRMHLRHAAVRVRCVLR